MKQALGHQFVTCLIGNKVDHSVSDVMFAEFAKAASINTYHHLKIQLSSNRNNELENTLSAIQLLKFKGANVTLPFKEVVCSHLTRIHHSADKIGAVNTLKISNSSLVGYNTDSVGAKKAIENNLGKLNQYRQVCIFGCGGTTRSVLYCFSSKKTRLLVIHRPRETENARALQTHLRKSQLTIHLISNDDPNFIHEILKSNLIINTTPVGMFPNSSESIISDKILSKLIKFNFFPQVDAFDVVFNPYITKFLSIAKENGARICPGIDMTIYQGIEAFKIWTGFTVKDQLIKDVRNKLIKSLFQY